MQGGLQVGGFEVGHLGQNLLGGEAGGEELKHVGYADAHAANAGPAATLARVGGDARELGFHGTKILGVSVAASAPGAAGLVSMRWGRPNGQPGARLALGAAPRGVGVFGRPLGRSYEVSGHPNRDWGGPNDQTGVRLPAGAVPH